MCGTYIIYRYENNILELNYILPLKAKLERCLCME